MPYEFEAFVMFSWPITLPYYLYRTRRWKGLLMGVELLAALRGARSGI